jgi:hypothetical protein
MCIRCTKGYSTTVMFVVSVGVLILIDLLSLDVILLLVRNDKLSFQELCDVWVCNSLLFYGFSLYSNYLNTILQEFKRQLMLCFIKKFLEIK